MSPEKESLQPLWAACSSAGHHQKELGLILLIPALCIFRIIESLWLEKTFQIIKSSCQSINTMPTKPYPYVATSAP